MKSDELPPVFNTQVRVSDGFAHVPSPVRGPNRARSPDEPPDAWLAVPAEDVPPGPDMSWFTIDYDDVQFYDAFVEGNTCMIWLTVATLSDDGKYHMITDVTIRATMEGDQEFFELLEHSTRRTHAEG